MASFGQVLVMFAAWVADQELESIKRRTRDGPANRGGPSRPPRAARGPPGAHQRQLDRGDAHGARNPRSVFRTEPVLDESRGNAQ